MRRSCLLLALLLLVAACQDATGPRQVQVPGPSFDALPTSHALDLGTLGGPTSFGWALNDLGHVVGGSATADGENHAFLWTPEEGMKDLGTLPGDVMSSALGINNHDDVVGYSMDAEWNQTAVLWKGGGAPVALWGGTGAPTRANGINDDGAIVGREWVYDPSVSYTLYERAIYRSPDGVVTVIPDPENFFADATAINDLGQVLGVYYVPGADRRGFIWSPSDDFYDIGSPGGNGPLFYDINDSDQVVGYDLLWRSFLWTKDGGADWIGDEPGIEYLALSVNESGHVAALRGDDATGTSQAVVWMDGSWIPLHTPTGFNSAGRAINESDQVAGEWNSGSSYRAVLWTLGPANPSTADDCKNGGWVAFGFKNQGQCIRFVNTGKDSR